MDFEVRKMLEIYSNDAVSWTSRFDCESVYSLKSNYYIFV
jgi:hypothetical protein